MQKTIPMYQYITADGRVKSPVFGSTNKIRVVSPRANEKYKSVAIVLSEASVEKKLYSPSSFPTEITTVFSLRKLLGYSTVTLYP